MNKKKRNKLRNWVLIIAGIAIALFAGRSLLTPKSIPLETVNATAADITTWYSFSGNIEANNRETILSERAATINEIFVSEGELVIEGKDLLDPSSGSNPEAGMDGEIAEIFVDENETVSPGTKLITIVDYTDLEVSVKVDEYELAAVTPGKEVLVRIKAIDKEFAGVVESISKEGTILNGVTYFIAVVKLDYDESLKVGMTAEVTLRKDEVKNAIALPMTAIQFDDDNTPYVFKKNAEGIAAKTPIVTGINDGKLVEIISGVDKGEEILLGEIVEAGGFPFGGGMGRGGQDGGN
ncbi:HlyD family efflux transporter periplasmic adaptor subunit [Alkalibacter rhizosphaerae]|uniref:HlyD family efflux transporter periplasmic adaptor subunit n=1 Tax=Alkalibacter rhizosphaerae TaxID=2815577 RepID=A0A975AI06_9FIRM|nr:HlyD family efflux transporter periplasmic adaptor subunit [Alkalibacter rhizosphaerae]QSX08035.1 HlyD family efflux transporter periplasmic adaptor subunit [Alkalibacter rhizosphaerae]